MPVSLNATHDPRRRSWIASAEDPATDFPLQNLPFGVFRSAPNSTPHIGIAIGDQVFDLHAAASAELLPAASRAACLEPSLNSLMALGSNVWSQLRARASECLGADTCPPGPARTKVERCLVAQSAVSLLLPAQVRDYTDFYASVFHATNVGALFRPEQPLLPNYKWVPIGYHGRVSSLVPSGTPIWRPKGQLMPAGSTAPIYAPCRSLDYEVELAAYVGPGNALGSPIPLSQAEDHFFGVSLLNDWSARDIQSWEYQPLGPFLAKNFASTLSPWIVTREALAPFRIPAFARPTGDPAPLPYLTDSANQQAGGIDITLEASLLTARMRAAGEAPHRLSRANFSTMYWTFAQLLTHHTSGGCNLSPGDLLGSGTVSGAEPGSRGCLLELTTRGSQPVVLPNGETRGSLLDGDEVILRGFAEHPGARRIGLGECRGTVLAALD